MNKLTGKVKNSAAAQTEKETCMVNGGDGIRERRRKKGIIIMGSWILGFWQPSVCKMF